MTPRPVRRTVARLAQSGVATIAIVELILLAFAPEGGPLGVIQIFAPHLAILALVLMPFALVDRPRTGAWTAAALVVVTLLRFGGDWLSLPTAAPAGSIRLEVATWNLEVQSRPGTTTAAQLEMIGADVVGLQERQADAAAAIEADSALRARYPDRDLRPHPGVLGLGLLSRYPLADESFAFGPVIQQAVVDLGGGRRIAIINTHPLHAEVASLATTRLPVGLDLIQRNADLVTIRDTFDAHAAAGLPVVLLGDLNTAASEPAFDRLVHGLRDVHAEVGLGTGWTWRPIRLEFLGLGLLRIDHVIVSPDIIPLAIGETCPMVGDHCLVHAEIAIPG
jgi:endonuclease/exonuclease/phosphatase (EEP) superfamily protein YafD